jgi:hypothetical protein
VAAAWAACLPWLGDRLRGLAENRLMIEVYPAADGEAAAPAAPAGAGDRGDRREREAG